MSVFLTGECGLGWRAGMRRGMSEPASATPSSTHNCSYISTKQTENGPRKGGLGIPWLTLRWADNLAVHHGSAGRAGANEVGR